MNYERYIAGRYLKSKKRTGKISFTTLFSFIVIVLGAGCITVFLSIMNGFESVVIDRFLALDSHIRVTGKGEARFPDPDVFSAALSSIPEMSGYSPYIMQKAMLISERGRMVVTIKAVDSETVDRVSRLRRSVVYGTDNFTSLDTVQTYPGIILGSGLIDGLGVKLGETVKMMSSRGVGRYFREPDIRTFEVTGFFESGISEYDYLYAYISLRDGQRFFRMDESFTGFDINAESLDKSGALAEKIRAAAPDNVLVKTWYDLHKNLYSSMKLEKIAAFIILSLIILVASFSIASSLIMLVLEKRNEIGILKSMGSDERGIKRIFMMHGMIIGVAGTFLGLAIGLTACWIQLRYEIIKLPQDIYIIGSLPVKINPLDFLIVGVISLALTFAATLYPAWKAARLKPALALRYE